MKLSREEKLMLLELLGSRTGQLAVKVKVLSESLTDNLPINARIEVARAVERLEKEIKTCGSLVSKVLSKGAEV